MSAQTLTARSGQTGFDVVSFNGLQDVNADPRGMFSSSGHSITVPLAGYYIVSGGYGTTLASTTFSQAAVLVKNGTIVSRGDEVKVINGGNTCASDVIHLNAGDAMTLGAYAEAAVAINTGAGRNVLSLVDHLRGVSVAGSWGTGTKRKAARLRA